MALKAVLVAGSRDWSDVQAVKNALSTYPRGTLLLHGNADGADAIAASMVDTFKFFELAIPYADWAGKRGGPMRNEVLIDVLIALQMSGYEVSAKVFWQSKSRGTSHMLSLLRKHNVTHAVDER